MPRRRRSAKVRATVPLTPAIAYVLMVGTWAPCRIRGWVAAALFGADEAECLAEAWTANRGALLAEAGAYGFKPFWATDTAPTGAGVRQWTDAFLRQHRY